MNYNLPIAVVVEGAEHKIRNNCDYRVVLDVLEALNDDELTNDEKIICALFIFYEKVDEITDFQVAMDGMMNIINIGENADNEPSGKPPLMDWHKDFNMIAPPVGRILGYDVREPGRYTHWWTFVGGYMEIGECQFSNVVSIRSKLAKGTKLEAYEESFYRENRNKIDLPIRLTAEEKAELESEW